MQDLFVSYSRRDKRNVMKIVSLLQSRGYSVWIDESGIETGEQFKKVIVNAIEECKVVLFFSSKHSNQSPWTAKEIGVANSIGKPIFPIKLDETDYNKELLFDLVNLDYCDLTNSTHRSEQIDGLLKSLNSLVGVIPTAITGKNTNHHKSHKHIVFITLMFLLVLVITFFYFRISRVVDVAINPQRGAILDEYGRKLAYSQELFDIYIDKEAISNAEDRLVKELSDQIAEVVNDGKNAYQYYSQLIDKRERYLQIAKGASDSLTTVISHLPLLVENKEGLILQAGGDRVYPYGNSMSMLTGRWPHDSAILSGIEYNLNDILSGTSGQTHIKRKFSFGVDKTILPKDGLNVRTTVNLEFQQLVDSLLRSQISRYDYLETGFIMILESSSGAVRAMSGDYADSNFGHIFSSECGSTFKTVSLAVFLEENDINLSDTVPTHHGKIPEYPQIAPDQYTIQYERKNQTNSMSVLDGVVSSSNYLFRKLISDHYADNPQKFVDILKEYRLDEQVDLGIESEFNKVKIVIPTPDKSTWHETDLLSLAIGYNLLIPQINILSFYNSIANNGIMVMPHLIEGYESDGKIIKQLKPSVKSKVILSNETVDSLKYALYNVSQFGTGQKLKNTLVAGMTGTTRLQLNEAELGCSNDPYRDEDGRQKYMASYIGFFPVDMPQYTVYASFQSRLTDTPIYGGVIAAEITGEIAEEICRWNPTLKKDIE